MKSQVLQDYKEYIREVNTRYKRFLERLEERKRKYEEEGITFRELTKEEREKYKKYIEGYKERLLHYRGWFTFDVWLWYKGLDCGLCFIVIDDVPKLIMETFDYLIRLFDIPIDGKIEI